MTETLGDALPKRMAEIRDVYIPAYEAAGPAGQPAISLMKAELDRAAAAMAEGDVIAMINSYQSLMEWKL